MRNYQLSPGGDRSVALEAHDVIACISRSGADGAAIRCSGKLPKKAVFASQVAISETPINAIRVFYLSANAASHG